MKYISIFLNNKGNQEGFNLIVHQLMSVSIALAQVRF